MASGSDGAAVTGSGRHHRWALLASLLAVAGTVGAVFAAGAVARYDSDKSRQAFEQSSAEVASTLQLAVQHEADLIVSAGAFILSNPGATNAEFDAWGAAMHWSERYPEVSGFGELVIVPASDLPAFAAHAQANPVRSLSPSGKFSVVPPGDRPYYCLSVLSQDRGAGAGLPVGFDFCAGEVGIPNLLARDSGQGSYQPFESGNEIWLGVVTPVYQRGVTPATVEARRKAFVGWVGMTVVPKMILDRALQGHPGMSVSMRYHASSSDVTFSSGRAPAGAQSVRIDLHNGWSVRTAGPAPSGAVWQNWAALALLVSGTALGVLVGVLVYVLATRQARALQLVQERTTQLRGAQAQLVDAARRAGMADIATDVLHNVGNVLNTVNVSAGLVVQKVRGSKSVGLSKAVTLMDEHRGDLGEFLTTDARGKMLPGYLDKLAAALVVEREGIDEELGRMTAGVAHIKEIVAAQQSLAGVGGVFEYVNINDLIDDALRMAGLSADRSVTVVRDLPDASLLLVDRHRVLLILVNLLSNATRAMEGNLDRPRRLSLRAEVRAGQSVSITVADNGEGIPPENLNQIFVHGFTTHADGHGYGLHGSALTAREMGGGLTVHSDGVGTGAVFTLDVPLESKAFVS